MVSNNAVRQCVAYLITLGGGIGAVQAADSDDQLEEIIVTGLRASYQESIAVKKDDQQIVEVIAADNMGKMPNVTVAESLVRLPGINGARDRGNESLATVRGLGPRMTMGTVNGREIASSEPTRAVRWEVFPTEIVSTVKVYKSQSADLIAGGVAATIDISTINPLDYTGPRFVATGGPVYYTEGKDVPGYSPWGDRVGASWVGRINDNLGFALGATYQKQKNANALMGGWGYTSESQSQDVNGDGTVDPTLWGAADQLKQIKQTRTGAAGALQWRGDNLELKLDGLYSKVEIRELQNQTWFNGWAYSIWSGSNPYATTGSSYTIVDGDVVAGTLAGSYTDVNHVIGQYNEDKDLSALGLNAKWTAGSWKLSGDLSTSAAKRDSDWRAVWFNSYPNTVSYDFQAGHTPSIALSDDTLNSFASFSDSGPDNLKDQISALALTARHDFDGAFQALEFGARYAEREKKHEHLFWSFPSVTAPSIDAFDGMTYFYSMPDLNVPAMLGGDLNAIANTAFGGWGASTYSTDLLQDWKVKEKVKEAYVKGIYDSQLFGQHVSGNVGLRFVGVNTRSTGYDQVGSGIEAVDEGKSYNDVLPSATLNFLFDGEHILRLAAAKVVARPPLDELRTGRYLDDPNVVTTGQRYGSGANPQLDPFRATQLDVSYEWYFHKESLLAVAAYRKWVDSIIGYESGHQTINGIDYLISGPVNGGGGYIDGAEITFQTPFYGIPALENFGIYSNVALVDSNLHEFSPTTNPYPLAGLAKTTAAVDLWYSNGKFDARLGYKYHSPYTIVYGWTESALSRLNSESVLDFSTSWQATDAFGVKLQIGNLTNEKLRAYDDNNPNHLANEDTSGGYQAFGRRYALEFSYKL